MKNFWILMLGILFLLVFSLPILAQEENQPPLEIQSIRLTESDLPGYTLSSGGTPSNYFDPNGLSGDYRPYQYGTDWVAWSDSGEKLGKWNEKQLAALNALNKTPTLETSKEFLKIRGMNNLDIQYVIMKTVKMAQETIKNKVDGRWIAPGESGLMPLKDYLIGDETYRFGLSPAAIPATSIVFRKGRVIVAISREFSSSMGEAKNLYNQTFNDCKNFAQLILSRIEASRLDQ
jgi:hypothetical protein